MNMNYKVSDKLRIVFMGTPEFAVTILDNLIQNNYNIVGVITSPDRPAGRGRKINKSAVKQYAEQKQLPILQPTNLKSEEFIDELKALNANLQIVVAFRMLPSVVWKMPEYGTFNLHASLLPNYRGAAPINWAIINGEIKTGVTTFYIDDKIDTGEMILQEEIAIEVNDSAGTLHDKLMHLGAQVVVKTVKAIENNSIAPRKQEFDSQFKPAPKIHKETCKVDWNQPLDQVYNFIRGLCPYPAAWTTLVNEDEELFLKIYEVSKEEEAHQLKNGILVSTKKELKVAVQNGFIKLHEIQLPGKRKMDTKDVLNGLKLVESASVV